MLRRLPAGSAAVLLLLIPVLMVFVVLRNDVSDGTTVTSYGVRGALGIGAASAHSGLRVGDQVVAIDHLPVAAWEKGRAPTPRPGPGARPFLSAHRAVGDRLVYTVMRGHRQLDIPVVLEHSSGRTLIAAFGQALPLGVDLVAIVVLVVAWADPAGRIVVALAAVLPFTVLEWPASPGVVDFAGGRGTWSLALADIASLACWCLLLGFVAEIAEVPARPRNRILLVVALGVASLAECLATPHPITALTDVSWLAARVTPFLLCLILIVGLLRSGPAEPERRRRIKTLLVGFPITLGIYIAVGPLSESVFGRYLVPTEVSGVVLVGLPLAVGIALLRGRLAGQLPTLTRALVDVVATLVSVAVFVTLAVLIGLLTGDGLTLLLALALCALGLAEFRQVIAGRLGWRLIGGRDSAAGAWTRIGGAAPIVAAPITESGLQTSMEGLAESIRTLLRVAWIRITMTEVVAEAGDRQLGGAAIRRQLNFGHEPVGEMELALAPSREPFGPSDEPVLNAVTHYTAVAASLAVSNAELQIAREKLVSAREDERLRIRQDLHDGLAPTLAAATLHLETGRLTGQMDQRTEESISAADSTIRSGLADIRRLVDGLRPATLDELGLIDALRERYPQGAVAVHGELGETALPAAVEVAAFHIVNEAVTNALRHGKATCVQVDLAVDATTRPACLIDVTDDGVGSPSTEEAAPSTRLGLRSMQQRARELGGDVHVSFSAGGAHVHAVLPLTRSSDPGEPDLHGAGVVTGPES